MRYFIAFVAIGYWSIIYVIAWVINKTCWEKRRG